MITMKIKQEILLRCIREKKPLSNIAKELGISRTTVHKYVKMLKDKIESIETSADQSATELLISELTNVPKYDTTNRCPRVVTEPIMKIITDCLKENDAKDLNHQHKQKMKGSDIYEKITKVGYNISQSTFYNTFKKINRQKREAFIRIEHLPGEECQFDWYDAKIYINNELKDVSVALFTMSYSNYQMAFIYPSKNMQCFQDAHAQFFKHIGRVPKAMRYDNLTTAVTKIYVENHKRQRVLTEGFIQLSTYYNFLYTFCNIAKGNEKGKVEKYVSFSRRKLFSQNDKFDTIEEANKVCYNISLEKNKLPKGENMKSSSDLLEEEKRIMRLCPHNQFECGDISKNKVNKYSCISFLNNQYSVPEEFVGSFVLVKSYAFQIKIYADNKNEPVAIHKRNYEKGQWIIDIYHFLNTFSRKPGAFTISTAFKQAPELLKELFENHFLSNQKGFIELMIYAKKNNITLKEIELVIDKLLKITTKPLTTDMIIISIDREKQVIEEQIVTEIDKIAVTQICEYSELLNI